jgi:hypothetical protein
MRRTECGIFSMKMKARERARESERVSERAREAERVRERERAWTALLLIHALA